MRAANFGCPFLDWRYRMINCTECETKVDDNNMCPNCGFNSEERRGTILLLECKNCKEPITCDDKYCNSCGMRLFAK